MLFSLTHEQDMLRDSAVRFLTDRYTFETWHAQARAAVPFDRANWQAMAELGWLAIGQPEDLDGYGGVRETMVIMEALGGALALEPYVSTCVAGAGLLVRANTEATRALLAEIMAGNALVALATEEVASRHNLAVVETRARAEGEHYVLDGVKCYVPDADTADYLIVSARTSGTATDPRGVSLFLVPRDTAGVSLRTFRGPDCLHASEVRLQGVRVPASALLGVEGGALDWLEPVRDHVALMRMAEALGVMDAAREATLAYLKTREQFGQPIGNFQALQHRMVDMAIACEEARAIVYAAVPALDDAPEVRRRAISAAKVRLGQSARFVGEQAVQLHGGIGTSDELLISHYLKRLLMIEATAGDTAFHLQRFADAA